MRLMGNQSFCKNRYAKRGTDKRSRPGARVSLVAEVLISKGLRPEALNQFG